MSDILVRIDGIPGESTLAGYQGQIDCSSMRHAIDLPVVAQGGGRTEGASAHGAIELTHLIDLATPALRGAAASGDSLGKVVITRMHMLGGTNVPAETIMLGGAYVARVDLDTPYDTTSGEPAETPEETFHLGYSEIKWSAETHIDGVKSGVVEGGWSTRDQTVLV